jgi:hypothetical protein
MLSKLASYLGVLVTRLLGDGGRSTVSDLRHARISLRAALPWIAQEPDRGPRTPGSRSEGALPLMRASITRSMSRRGGRAGLIAAVLVGLLEEGAHV